MNIGTDPNKVDTDDDGIPDGKEYLDLNTDPTDFNDPSTIGTTTTQAHTTTTDSGIPVRIPFKLAGTAGLLALGMTSFVLLRP